jgi:hypothetical protein
MQAFIEDAAQRSTGFADPCAASYTATSSVGCEAF